MPQLKREMSWLSPRRRRTTGNLKADANGTNGKLSGESNRTSTTSGSPSLERPSNALRAISHPAADPVNADGNLFYAYARKVVQQRGDDLHSRYLLTFASATIANEWWLLLQIHFPGSTRPGPQLFSFKEDDALSKAWQHASFAHLKSKWMYISFSSSATSDNEALSLSNGGAAMAAAAAQSIIPVQDAQGNMLGSGARNIDGILPELRDEAQELVRSEVGRLEEYVAGMMEALQRNTEKAAELAAKISGSKDGVAKEETALVPTSGPGGNGNGNYFDMDALSTHFGQLNQSLNENSQNVQKLAEQHSENEQRLRETLETLASKPNREPFDMQQLASHLDRIQNMMEASVRERKDSAREIPDRPQQVDFSPLTLRLEKVQEAIEQNSALIKALLDEGAGSSEPKDHSPPQQVDLAPLTASLERIHAAVEQQSEHTRALVGFASGEGDGADSAAGTFHQDRHNLTPLGEHLEQIYNAIEEGNKQARETHHRFDLGPLRQHLEVLQGQGGKMDGHMERVIESQNAVREAVEANGGELAFSPLANHLEKIRESTDASTEAVKRATEVHMEAQDKGIDFGPLTQHLEAIRQATERNAEELHRLVEAQQASAAEKPGIDLSPLTTHLSSMRSTLEKQTKTTATGEAKSMTALTSHLSQIQEITEQNAQQMKSLREKHAVSATKMQNAVIDTSEQVRRLLERNEQNESKIDAQNSQMRELMSGQREMVEVMRQLAKGLTAQNKESCGHVVIPPPRKMNRKLVGFVYDTKEGTA